MESSRKRKREEDLFREYMFRIETGQETKKTTTNVPEQNIACLALSSLSLLAIYDIIHLYPLDIKHRSYVDSLLDFFGITLPKDQKYKLSRVLSGKLSILKCRKIINGKTFKAVSSELLQKVSREEIIEIWSNNYKAAMNEYNSNNETNYNFFELKFSEIYQLIKLYQRPKILYEKLPGGFYPKTMIFNLFLANFGLSYNLLKYFSEADMKKILCDLYDQPLTIDISKKIFDFLREKHNLQIEIIPYVNTVTVGMNKMEKPRIFDGSFAQVHQKIHESESFEKFGGNQIEEVRGYLSNLFFEWDGVFYSITYDMLKSISPEVAYEILGQKYIDEQLNIQNIKLLMQGMKQFHEKFTRNSTLDQSGETRNETGSDNENVAPVPYYPAPDYSGEEDENVSRNIQAPETTQEEGQVIGNTGEMPLDDNGETVISFQEPLIPPSSPLEDFLWTEDQVIGEMLSGDNGGAVTFQEPRIPPQSPLENLFRGTEDKVIGNTGETRPSDNGGVTVTHLLPLIPSASPRDDLEYNFLGTAASPREEETLEDLFGTEDDDEEYFDMSQSDSDEPTADSAAEEAKNTIAPCKLQLGGYRGTFFPGPRPDELSASDLEDSEYSADDEDTILKPNSP